MKIGYFGFMDPSLNRGRKAITFFFLWLHREFSNCFMKMVNHFVSNYISDKSIDICEFFSEVAQTCAHINRLELGLNSLFSSFDQFKWEGVGTQPGPRSLLGSVCFNKFEKIAISTESHDLT